jgi:hypothetical protein
MGNALLRIDFNTAFMALHLRTLHPEACGHLVIVVLIQPAWTECNLVNLVLPFTLPRHSSARLHCVQVYH